MLRLLAGAFMAALFVASPVHAEAPVAPQSEPGVEAIYAYSGRYTFRVDARNRYSQWINRGYATASVGGNRATIRVRVDGYKDATAYVNLREGTYRYDVRLTMDDPSIYVDVKDENHGYVNAYSRADNFGVWADKYRFESRINTAGFEKFTANDVEVRVNGLSSFGADVRVSAGLPRRVEVTIRRRDLRSFSNRIVVSVPSDASFGQRGEFRKVAFEEIHAEPNS